jgi:hypothetical protein
VAKRIVRSFSASPRDLEMLEALVPYHGLSKSALITSLIRKEFWRVFPAGTDEIPPQKGARIKGGPTS